MTAKDLNGWLADYPLAIVGVLATTSALLVIHFVATRFSRRATDPLRPFGWMTRLLYVGFCVTVITLSGTAFFATFTSGHLEHWPLLIHVVAAGPFVVLLSLLSLLWARAAAPLLTTRRMSGLAKLSFAVVLLAAVVTVASMLANMFPLFSTAEMESLLDIHRYGGLALVSALIIHAYAVLHARRSGRST